MRRWLMMLTLLLAGCVTAAPVSGEAVCAGTRAARDNLAAALVADGGPRALVAGQRLIARIDAGCAG